MKIAIFADGSDLNAKVASRLGASECLLMIDADSGEFEAVPNPAGAGRHFIRGPHLRLVSLD